MFDDNYDFFGGGLGMTGGRGGGFTSFSSSSFGGMGGMGGMGESISQQTVIENGRQKTITKKTTTDRNGNRQTEIIEEFRDPRTGEHVRNKYLDNGISNGGGHGVKSIQGGQKRRR